jgi:hypothetical protein
MGACARNTVSLTAALLLTAGLTQSALGFGVFTHEALSEISWQLTSNTSRHITSCRLCPI